MVEEVIDTYNRTSTFSEKYDARLEKFGAEDLIPLWVADMDLPTSPAILKALSNRIAHPIFGYHHYHDKYLEAIQHWMYKQHHWQVALSDISPINTIVSALAIAVDTFSDEGDGVLIQTPIYPPFMQTVLGQKRKLLDNTLTLQAGRYVINFDDFEKKAKEAKLFLFCSPHNPTGRVWEKEELEKLAEICYRHDVVIIADEVHADLCYHDNIHIPIATLPQARDISITLNAPSKTFNVASIVNAYAICHNPTLFSKFLKPFKNFALINPNPLSMVVTIAAYHDSDAWLVTLKDKFLENLQSIYIKLDKMASIRAVKPEATFLLWLDCRGLGMDDKALKAFFVDKAKLGLNPGISFGRAASGFMRLNFAHENQEIEQAMQQLLQAYNKR
jgi:cystathionine beta-lyase